MPAPAHLDFETGEGVPMPAPSRVPEFCRIAPDVTLGANVTFFAFVNLYGCAMGDNSHSGAFVEVQKDASIGRTVKGWSHTFCCEGVQFGDDVFVRHNASFIN